MIKKYKKKPVVIEAVQYYGQNKEEIDNFIGSVTEEEYKFDGDRTNSASIRVLFIQTLEGKMEVSPMDYVIKGVQGEFYPCKPDIFKQTYEEA